jgi:hypothetical protein
MKQREHRNLQLKMTEENTAKLGADKIPEHGEPVRLLDQHLLLTEGQSEPEQRP